jgi:hypothetical protein
MKNLRILVCLVIFGVIVGVTLIKPPLVYATDGTTVSPISVTESVSAKGETKAFTGKVIQAQTQDGKTIYALQESSSQNLFMLDDQEKAKQFEGKDVKVTGTMDSASNTIHVVDIEAV